MTIPRNVMLMDEFENSMKGKYECVSFGIVNDDITLTNWHGSIITRKGDIFEFNFTCDDKFPLNPPDITFDKNILNNKYIVLICDEKGKLKQNVLNNIKWSNSSSIGVYLMNIKKMLDN